MKIWSCKIGEVDEAQLPRGADSPMRNAVEEAYERITGREAVFIFSGWGAELTEPERAVVEDRLPELPEGRRHVVEANRLREGLEVLVQELRNIESRQESLAFFIKDPQESAYAEGRSHQAHGCITLIRELLEDTKY